MITVFAFYILTVLSTLLPSFTQSAEPCRQPDLSVYESLLAFYSSVHEKPSPLNGTWEEGWRGQDREEVTGLNQCGLGVVGGVRHLKT